MKNYFYFKKLCRRFSRNNYENDIEIIQNNKNADKKIILNDNC